MRRSAFLPTIAVTIVLLTTGIAPSSGTEVIPTPEEEVLANGNEYSAEFDLLDVPSGFTYDLLIGGEIYTPPKGDIPGVYEPEPLRTGGTSSGVTYSTMATTTTWAACGTFDKETKTVRTFSRNYVSYLNLFAGNSPLKCGNNSYGFRHIKLKHTNDWGSLGGLVGSNWRDFADWSINQCLKWPASVANNGTKNTYEFKAPIQIRDKRTGKVISTKYCNVPISRGSSRQLITAFPSSK